MKSVQRIVYIGFVLGKLLSPVSFKNSEVHFKSVFSDYSEVEGNYYDDMEIFVVDSLTSEIEFKEKFTGRIYLLSENGYEITSLKNLEINGLQFEKIDESDPYINFSLMINGKNYSPLAKIDVEELESIGLFKNKEDEKIKLGLVKQSVLKLQELEIKEDNDKFYSAISIAGCDMTQAAKSGVSAVFC